MILQRIRNVDVADADGIKPLYLVSMMSQSFVTELLTFVTRQRKDDCITKATKATKTDTTKA